MTVISSMTGFGSARGSADWGNWSVEARSVNGRGLDVRVSCPQGFETLDRHAKAGDLDPGQGIEVLRQHVVHVLGMGIAHEQDLLREAIGAKPKAGGLIV